MSHGEEQLKNSLIMWLRKKAVKDRDGALCIVSAYLSWMAARSYLEEIFKVLSHQTFHLGRIGQKLSNGGWSKRRSLPVSDDRGVSWIRQVTRYHTSYLWSNWWMRPGFCAVMIRNKWINNIFHTPISNSCNKSTTRARNILKPICPRQSENAF